MSLPSFHAALPLLLALAAASCGKKAPSGPCPDDMVPIPGMKACIDRYEAAIETHKGKEVAVSRKGALPSSKTTFFKAEAACAGAGKRICALKEWDRACGGEEGRTYPYGKEYAPARCNSADAWDDASLAKPKPSGWKPLCATPEGVHDLSGNVWEWTAEKDGSGAARLLRGGGYANREALLDCKTSDEAYQPADQAFDGYGFRCCRDFLIPHPLMTDPGG